MHVIQNLIIQESNSLNELINSFPFSPIQIHYKTVKLMPLSGNFTSF